MSIMIYRVECCGQEHRVLLVYRSRGHRRSIVPIDCAWEQIAASEVASGLARTPLAGCAELARTLRSVGIKRPRQEQTLASWQATPWSRALLCALEAAPWIRPEDQHTLKVQLGPAWFAREVLLPLRSSTAHLVRAHHARPTLLLSDHQPLIGLSPDRRQALVLALGATSWVSADNGDDSRLGPAAAWGVLAPGARRLISDGYEAWNRARYYRSLYRSRDAS